MNIRGGLKAGRQRSRDHAQLGIILLFLLFVLLVLVRVLGFLLFFFFLFFFFLCRNVVQ